MGITRKIYRRVTTTERIVLQPEQGGTGPIHGDACRGQVFVRDGQKEKLVCEREHTFWVDVDEEDDEQFILTGLLSLDKGTGGA